MSTGSWLAILASAASLAGAVDVQAQDRGQVQAKARSRDAPRCVLQSRVAAPVVREDGQLYFRGQPDRRQSYIARFKGGTCPGLNPFAAVIVETSAVGYCEGDKVRALMSPGQIAGPRCVIDHLEPFSGDVDDPIPDAPQGEK
jgi:hypothetical protein